MHVISGTTLWIGHAGDARDLSALNDRGIRAVVDLAREEPPPALSRDLVILRIPLVDGPGNPRWLLDLAVDGVARLLRQDVSTLVACRGGMSRSPAIAAGALVRLRECSFEEALTLVTKSAPADVDPGFAAEVRAAVD